MKFLCIGDQHIQPKNIPEIDILISRLESLLSICNTKDENTKDTKEIEKDTKLFSKYGTEKYDFVVLMGDCLHTHEKLNTLCLSKAHDLIKMISLYTHCFVLLGNHDIINNSQEFPDEHPFVFASQMKNVTIINKMTAYTFNDNKIKEIDNKQIDNYSFILSPYVPDNRFVPLLTQTFNDKWTNVKFILGHQLIKGAKMGAIISEKGDIWKSTYPQLISGHIHDKQTLADNMYYTGSVLQHAFGEKGDKTILSVNLNSLYNNLIDNKLTDNKSNDDNSLKEYMTEINLHLPEKKLLYFESIKQLKNFKTVPENTKIKISVSGSPEEFNAYMSTSKYKELKNMGVTIIFKPTRSEIKQSNEQLNKQLNKQKTTKTFDQLLKESIDKEKSSELLKLYNDICLSD